MSARGKRENQQRQQQAHRREPLGGSHDAHGSEGETKEIRAPIPHEDAGGVEVVPQEAEAAARQRCGKESSGHLMQRKADGNQPNSGNASNSRSKTIKAIQPVDGIGDPYQPNHSGQQAEAVGQSNRTG